MKVAAVGPFARPTIVGDVQFLVTLDGAGIGQFNTDDQRRTIPEQIPGRIEELLTMRPWPRV